MLFADIILPLHLPKPLTYGIPYDKQAQIVPGIRVEVALGRNKIYAGIVLKVHDNKPTEFSVKPIKSIIDTTPIVNETQLNFWSWVANYYLCSIGEVMQAALPAHLKLMGETLLIWSNLHEQIPSNLPEEAIHLANYIREHQQISISELRAQLKSHQVAEIVNLLLDHQIVFISELLEEKYNDKTERYIFLSETYKNDDVQIAHLFDSLKRSPKQEALLMTYFQLIGNKEGLPASLLLNSGKYNPSILKSLEEKGVFYSEQIKIDRIGNVGSEIQASFSLNQVQEEALKNIKHNWQQFDVNLLHGVTGSGKTLIYIQIIKEILAKGHQALYLLPEIALTTHIVSRLKAYFGNELGVYHSGYTNNERVEIWKKVLNGTYKVVLGPRSALWLPFNDLKVIIIDEEHDTSFKQTEPVPRYQARDAAIYLGHLHQAKVLLGTATPSIETFFNVSNNKYGYTPLLKRYRGVSLPEIELVPAKNIQQQLSPFLTLNLLSAIQDTIRDGRQVILFQNKRGYTPLLMCTSCGWVPHCKNCDVTLTYHKSSDKLHCHYCGTKFAPVKICPQCGNGHITARSFGTERIEEDLKRIFPHYNIGRMDWDSMNTKTKQNALLNDFISGKINILIGTQMVVKGLDFENVNLVGVLSADSLLSFPDFRVNERAYQLLEQVSGRAGRMDGKGKVMLQTYKKSHPVFSYVIHHDYQTFYTNEIQYRKDFSYPPFARLIKIICKHKDEQKVLLGATTLTRDLQNIPNIYIQGPSAPVIAKIRNYFIQEIWIKAPNNAKALATIKKQIQDILVQMTKYKGLSGFVTFADVDPL